MGKIDFGQNYHPEFEGYVWEKDGGIWISFIESKEKGKGNFSKLLDEYMAKYLWIKIPTPFALMEAIALKKGFAKTKEYFPEVEEEGEVMLWKKEGVLK